MRKVLAVSLCGRAVTADLATFECVLHKLDVLFLCLDKHTFRDGDSTFLTFIFYPLERPNPLVK